MMPGSVHIFKLSNFFDHIFCIYIKGTFLLRYCGELTSARHQNGFLFPQKMLDGKHRRDYYGNSICPCSLVVRSQADLCHMTVRAISCKALAYVFISKLKFMFMCLPNKETEVSMGCPVFCIFSHQGPILFSA